MRDEISAFLKRSVTLMCMMGGDAIVLKIVSLLGTHLACVLECVRFEMCVLSRVWLSLAAGSIPAASTRAKRLVQST